MRRTLGDAPFISRMCMKWQASEPRTLPFALPNCWIWPTGKGSDLDYRGRPYGPRPEISSATCHEAKASDKIARQVK